MNIYRKTTISNVVNFINEEIKLSGWIASKRDHGSLIFLELRDSSGTIQLVLDSHVLKDPISLESVVSIDGLVQKRSPENINSQNPLGYLEVQVKTLKVLSYCSNLPFLPEVAHTVNDELQLKYRYIALRNSQCLNKVLMKSKISTYMREFMNSQEFQEISTPIITASSPEGARDFLIPSRLHPGKFYALPQAPQIYKQLLMVSGINRYFQVAPCFRDEDARADRNYGEFHQLDFEMSFSTTEDVLNLLEKLMNYVLGKVCKKPIKFTRITYDESLKTYGSDKPNLNNPLKLEDFTEIFANSSMDLFKNKILRENAVIKGVRIKEPCDGEKVLQFTQERGFRAAYISKHNGVLKGPISKFLPENIVENGETIFFVCDELYEACEKTGIIIKYFEKKFNEINHIVFVTDFPMFEKTEDGSFTFKHNPFSMPQCDKIDENNLDKIYAHQYDMVLNGYELASGSMRNHKIDLLSHCLKICKMNSDHILTRAFHHGVPPHAGAAIGIDRLAMLLTNSQNTREVNAFPMSTNGTDNLMNSPSVIDKKTLDELYIAIKS